MKLNEKIQLLADLKEQWQKNDENWQRVVNKAVWNNPWYTKENVEQRVTYIQNYFLKMDNLNQFSQKYALPDLIIQPKIIALRTHGQMPLDSFHDFIALFLSGHTVQLLLDDRDKPLFMYLLNTMRKINPAITNHVQVVPRLKDFDAVIMHQNDLSSQLLVDYFGKYPHLFRTNKKSVAILSGKETPTDIDLLGRDVFYYFGLNHRSVGKILVPQNYNFTYLLDNLQGWNAVKDHNKYHNNFEYHYALALLNQTPHYASKYLLLLENNAVLSPVGTLNYSYYSDKNDLANKLIEQRHDLQCLVGDPKWQDNCVPFGEVHYASLETYDNKQDVMSFLKDLMKD